MLNWGNGRSTLFNTILFYPFEKRITIPGQTVNYFSYILKHADQWGGVIEFYNSPEEKKWTDSGPNVPHYPALSGIWWSALARAVNGELTPRETMTSLARQQDEMMGRLKMEEYAPELGPLRSRDYWLERPGAPKPERPRPKPQTVPYDELIKRWAKQ